MRTRRLAHSSSNPTPSGLRARSAQAGVGGALGSRSLRTKGPRAEGHHVPVLLHESLEALLLQKNDVVVDATLGGGGHAKAIAELLDPSGTLIGIDADEAAVERTYQALSYTQSTPKTHLIVANFRALSDVLRNLKVEHITKALFDLGWSSYQLRAGRGFSFLTDEPLLMTYAADITPQTLTAKQIVNAWEEHNIADVIYGWGEERYSRRIAKAIVEARRKKPIQTARELSEIITRAVPKAYAHGKLHPATRTFQALRIAVNDELGALREGLAAAWNALSSGGRLAVITFHSIEDREVKHLMRAWKNDGAGTLVTRSPIRASRDEIRENPRARSAKLRVIEKI